MRSRSLLILGAVQFVDVVSFSLLLPMLPALMRTYRLSESGIGLLLAAYALAALVGAAVFGRLSDRWGRKPVLVGSCVLAAEGLLALAVSGDVWMLSVARLASGFAAGNIVVAEASRMDLGADTGGAKPALGLAAAAYGLGMVAGPLFAAAFFRYGLWAPAAAAALAAVVTLAGVVVLLPETSAPQREDVRRRRTFDASAFGRLIGRPDLGPLLGTRAWYVFALATFQSVFAIVTIQRFGLATSQQAWLLAYVGVTALMAESFATERFAGARQSALLRGAVGATAVLLLAWPFAPTVTVLVLLVGPLAAATGVVAATGARLLADSREGREVQVSSASTASEGVARVVAPVFGTQLVVQVGAHAPGIAAGLVLLGLTAYLSATLSRSPRRRGRPQPA